MIVTGIFPPDVGGPATHAPVIAAMLAARGHSVTVVTMGDPAGTGDDADAFQLIRVPRRRRSPIGWAGATAAIVRAGRRAEVIYALGLLPQATLASLVLHRPVVARVVSDVAWDRARAYGWTDDELQTFNARRYGPAIELLKSIQYGAVRRATLVIVPSRWLAGWVGRLGVPADRIRVVFNALASLPPIVPRRTPAGTPYLVAAMARLVRFKQTDLAIRTVAGVPDATLLVIGDGPQRVSLQQLAASLGVGERVIFTGAQPRDEALALLAGCDVLIQSSSYEGLPHGVLEAMTLGVPVLATPVGGTAEVIVHERNGLLADGNETALRNALVRMLSAPHLRRQLADRARADVAARFRPEDMAAATEQVLAEAAGMRR